MKKIAILLLLVAGCGQANNPPAPPTPAIDTMQAESDLIAAHNKTRVANQKPVLILNELLMKAAAVHSEDMANKTFMSHTGSDWSSPATRMARTGYKAQAGGENVAGGYSTVKAVMDGWMKSAGHRRNILGNYRDFGVAVRIGKNGTAYWTAVFGTPQ